MSDSNWQERTIRFLGEDAVRHLQGCKVAVVGLGGVGSYAAELVCRAGVGRMLLIDGDVVQESNINRQLFATHSSVGKFKSELALQRLQDINPSAELEALNIFINDSDDDKGIFDDCDFVIDAIDMVPSKIALIEYCIKHKIRIISSMGAAGRCCPEEVRCTDISKTHTCPLAKTIRKKLKERGIYSGLPVIFSTEPARLGIKPEDNLTGERPPLGTISFLPAVFGCHLAAYVLAALVSSNA